MTQREWAEELAASLDDIEENPTLVVEFRIGAQPVDKVLAILDVRTEDGLVIVDLIHTGETVKEG